ncbi:hypothetical protein CCR75_009690 [Bremia lactucae]|uniref:Uncharacterized protein n=1 Tax=Bremia lactucae TaxID=4779 RepID=A0A976FPV0_BRELC|nr:hypothetical protein CCR75_009690 [Bremia lactucae]
MPATTTTSSSSPVADTAKTSPLSVQRPVVRKRKLSEASAASPTSLDDVSSSNITGERVISPKKKFKAEDRASGNLNKWESHVVSSIANSLDLDVMAYEDSDKDTNFSPEADPNAFSAAPMGDLAADEMHIFLYFLA